MSLGPTCDSKHTATATFSEKLQAAEKLIVLSYNYHDRYIKRAALAKGWIEQQSSVLQYRVFWEYNDTNHEVQRAIGSTLFYNHFPDSRELTTKQGLNKNLQNMMLPGVDIYDFYPRCYDLSDVREIDLFH